jgi:hypothetical protein
VTIGAEHLQHLRAGEDYPGAGSPIKNARLSEMRRLIDKIGASTWDDSNSDASLNAMAMLLVDAALDQDEETLSEALTALKRVWAARAREDAPAVAEQRGRLAALADIARWAVERTPPVALLAGLVRSGSHAFRMLEAIAARPGLSNTDLMARLDVGETEVSRCGRRLVDGNLVVKRSVGRSNSWSLTPMGERVVASARSAELQAGSPGSALDSLMAEPFAAPAERERAYPLYPARAASRIPGQLLEHGSINGAAVNGNSPQRSLDSAATNRLAALSRHVDDDEMSPV